MTSVAIIDDDDGIRAALGTLMRAEHYEVSTYVSVEEFLAARRVATPAVIITDAEMPGLNGWDLIEILDRREVGVPVIVITGRPDEGIDPIRSRTRYVLRKPFDSSILCSVVAGLSAPIRPQQARRSREE
ncbi:MAG TPA: response regulator [Ktedonobacterales bacterium]|nr:response regulator [Ktedonobacterales bacterium]